MTSYWVGVASRDHVLDAVRGGFCMLNHGKAAALQRLVPGDGLVYYSPRTTRHEGEPLQAFTAIATVLDAPIRQVRHSDTFHPYRRDVRYLVAVEAPIRPLLTELSFTSTAGPSWGQIMRRGTFRIERGDYQRIARAMGLENAD